MKAYFERENVNVAEYANDAFVISIPEELEEHISLSHERFCHKDASLIEEIGGTISGSETTHEGGITINHTQFEIIEKEERQNV